MAVQKFLCVRVILCVFICSMAVPKKTSTSVCTSHVMFFISSKFKFIIIIVELLFD